MTIQHFFFLFLIFNMDRTCVMVHIGQPNKYDVTKSITKNIVGCGQRVKISIAVSLRHTKNEHT